VELKLVKDRDALPQQEGLNRTRVELKRGGREAIAVTASGLNRTRVELKRQSIFLALRKGAV